MSKYLKLSFNLSIFMIISTVSLAKEADIKVQTLKNKKVMSLTIDKKSYVENLQTYNLTTNAPITGKNCKVDKAVFNENAEVDHLKSNSVIAKKDLIIGSKARIKSLEVKGNLELILPTNGEATNTETENNKSSPIFLISNLMVNKPFKASGLTSDKITARAGIELSNSNINGLLFISGNTKLDNCNIKIVNITQPVTKIEINNSNIEELDIQTDIETDLELIFNNTKVNKLTSNRMLKMTKDNKSNITEAAVQK